MKDFLDKLQKQPEYIRKMILWITVIIIALVLAVWWIHSSYWRVKNFQTQKIIEDLNLPKIDLSIIEEQ